MRWGAWLAACIALATGVAPARAQAPPDGAAAQIAQPKRITADAQRRFSVGLIVNGLEISSAIDALGSADAVSAIDLDAFLAGAKLHLHGAGGALWIPTPLGNATVDGARLIRRGSQRFITVEALVWTLAARVHFERNEYAVSIELPWNPAGGDRIGNAVPLHTDDKPDVTAPAASLARVHSEVDETVQGGSRTSTSVTDLTGALGPGVWRTSMLTGVGSRPALYNYGWLYEHGGARVYVGNSSLELDPLLPTSVLTGAQAVWSNRPDISYGNQLSAGEIVASQSLMPAGLSGHDGPPGGIAVLRVDGQAIARVTIQLDGSWQFSDVVIRSTQFAEVALYDRYADATPVSVVPVNSAVSERSLPEGAFVAYGGLGEDGNPLYSPPLGTHATGGFYQLRWGAGSAVTLDASALRTGGRSYEVGNAVMTLGPIGVWDLGYAQSDGSTAWSVRGNGARGRWFWDAFVVQREAGFIPELDASQYYRFGEFGAHVLRGLDLSVVGGESNDPLSGGDYRYVKPALTWRVAPTLSLAARPDYDGSYTYAVNWVARPDTRLLLTRYAGLTQADLSHDLSANLRVDLTAADQPLLGRRFGQTLSGWWPGLHALSWDAGLLEGNGRVGFGADLAMQVMPGIAVHGRLYRDPLGQGPSGATLFELSVLADLAITPSGLAAGNYSPAWLREGQVVGVLRAELPDGVHWSDLAGIALLVDGRASGTVDARGHFAIDHLAPGVYRVELDREHLPLELMPPTSAPLVEVRSGVATRLDIPLALRLGFAGRITTADHVPMPGAPVRVTDAQGATVRQSRADALGYYRIDNLPSGHYVVSAAGHTRPCDLERRFLFGIDLPGAD